MPTPSRLSKSCSVSSALFPDISILETEGLSATPIIKVLPSRAIVMSSNCSVLNKDLVISVDLLKSILSPTVMGIMLKILPVETL